MSDAPPSAEPGFDVPQWALWVVAMVLAMATVFATVRVGMRVQLAVAAKNFEPTNGTVVVSELVQRGGDQLPVARVLVEYEVDGAAQSLRTTGRDGLTPRFQTSHDVVAAYPVGSNVVVFHDPDRPARAALVQEVKYAGELGFAIGLLLVLVGYVVWIRRRGRQALEA